MPLDPITPSGVGTAELYPVLTSAGQGLTPIFGASPGNTNAPIIFEPPPELSGNQLELWIVATGASANWGGCQVLASVDAGGTGGYGVIGYVMGGQAQGVLTADFALGSDPDTTDTLSVDLTQSRGQLSAGTTTDADKYATLCYLASASGYELAAFSGPATGNSSILTGKYQYSFGGYIRRGAYGTAIADHPSGSAFARLTGAVFRQVYPANLVGSTIWFKFPALNVAGAELQSPSDVPAYSYTLLGTGLPAGGLGAWFQPFSVGGKFTDLVADEWDGNYELFDVVMPVAVTFAANFSTSSAPGCEVAPGGNVTLTLQQIHNGTPTTVGTLSIASGQTTGSYSCSAMTISAGDRLRLYAPSSVDTAIVGLFGTLIGSR